MTTEANAVMSRLPAPPKGRDERRAVVGAVATMSDGIAPQVLAAWVASYHYWARRVESIGALDALTESDRAILSQAVRDASEHRDAFAYLLRKAGYMPEGS